MIHMNGPLGYPIGPRAMDRAEVALVSEVGGRLECCSGSCVGVDGERCPFTIRSRLIGTSCVLTVGVGTVTSCPFPGMIDSFSSWLHRARSLALHLATSHICFTSKPRPILLMSTPRFNCVICIHAPRTELP